MDLPTCPACKQSVLDDEAENCPFCGASLTGKPGAVATKPAPVLKPPVKKPAVGAPTPAEAAPPAKAASRSKPNSQTDLDADPYATDTSVAGALPVQAKKSAKNSHEVHCPMCEAKGYVPPSAAGKLVKCVNPGCLVPIFTAQALPAAPVAPPPPPAPKMSPVTIGILVVLFLAVVGGGSYAVVLMNAPPPASNTVTVDPALGRGPLTPPAVVDDPDTPPTTPETPVAVTPPVPTAVAAPTPAELQARIFTAMLKAAPRREGNRSRPFSRRANAIAFATTGDVAKTREELTNLQNLSDFLPYFKVAPLTTLAWAQLAAGDSTGAGKSLDEAVAAAAQLPQVGRERLENAVELAAVLTAAKRGDEARALISQHQLADATGQLAAMIVIDRNRRTFQIDREAPGSVAGGWRAPQWVAVTIILAARGRMAEALDWATQAPNLEAENECTLAWGEMFVREAHGKQAAPDQARLEAAAANLEPAGQARFWARVAVVQAELGLDPAATATVELALAAFTKLPVPAPTKFKGYPGILALELPNPVPLRQALLAGVELARAQQVVLKKSDAAEQSVTTGMSFARAMAPNPTAISQQMAQVESQGASSVRQQLKAVLDLDTDDEARLRYNALRRKLTELERAAADRFQLQTAALATAIDWGLADAVWLEVRTRSSEADPQDQEPFLQTILPGRLKAAFTAAGKTDEVAAVVERAGTKDVNDLELTLRTADQPASAAPAINAQGNTTEAHAWALRLTSRLTAGGDDAKTMLFISQIKNILIREEALRLWAALAARQGRANAVWQLVSTQPLTPTEEISSLLGIVEGMAAAQPAGG